MQASEPRRRGRPANKRSDLPDLSTPRAAAAAEDRANAARDQEHALQRLVDHYGA